VPDLVIAKSHLGNFTQGQVGAQYSIIVTNMGNAPTDGSTVTVTDLLPVGLTATFAGSGGWNCTQPSGPCTRNEVLPATSSYAPLQLTVNVANNAPLTLTNSVTVAGGGETNTANDGASDMTTVIPGPDLGITKTHLGNFTQGQVGATYTITVTNGGGTATDGSQVTVTDVLPSGLTATGIIGGGWICGQPSGPCTRSDALAPATPYPPITLTVNVSNSAAATVTNNVNVTGGGDVNPANNATTDPTTVIPAAPDMTIAKTHLGNFRQGQVGATYSIVVTNGGSLASTGTVTVTDTLPSGLTATGISGTGWTSCTQPAGPCSRSDALAPAAPYPSLVLTVNVAGNAAALITNTATVSGGGETNTANDVASDDTIVTAGPDLTISKTHLGNFSQGQVGAAYTITVTNGGLGPTDGSIVTVTDALPVGVTATGISGGGWLCTQPSGPCTRSDVLLPASAYPALTLLVNVANNAGTPITNTATVAGGGDVNLANNSASDSATVAAGPDLTIAKTHIGNFTQGQVAATYAITVTNTGTQVSSGSVTVTESVPVGLTATAMTGGGWACTQPAGPCTRSDPLLSAGSYPAITLMVTVAANAPAQVTNTVNVSGGGDVNAVNNAASDVTNITSSAPDLTIAKTHAGSFLQGQVGATYSIVVTNSGSLATSGTVTVTDALPAGLTATGIAGNGWTCTQPAGPCTRSDALAPATSYLALTLTVNVAANAAASITNTATVSGGGETNVGNDTASDLTAVNVAAPDLTITKTHFGNLTQGQIGAVYTITVTNSGTAPTNGSTVTVSDLLPAGLTATATAGTGWNCTQPAGPCTRSDVLAPSANYSPLAVSVNVAANAAATLINTATVTGGGDSNPGNNTVNDVTGVVPPGSATNPANAIPALGEYALLLLVLLTGLLGAGYAVRRPSR
jgi:uncharacterized repeat protein (TIGR01451 family)